MTCRPCIFTSISIFHAKCIKGFAKLRWMYQSLAWDNFHRVVKQNFHMKRWRYRPRSNHSPQSRTSQRADGRTHTSKREKTEMVCLTPRRRMFLTNIHQAFQIPTVIAPPPPEHGWHSAVEHIDGIEAGHDDEERQGGFAQGLPPSWLGSPTARVMLPFRGVEVVPVLRI